MWMIVMEPCRVGGQGGDGKELGWNGGESGKRRTTLGVKIGM